MRTQKQKDKDHYYLGQAMAQAESEEKKQEIFERYKKWQQNEVIETFVIKTNIALNHSQHKKALQAINLELVGDPTVNEYNKKGEMVGKYDNHPNAEKLLKSHHHLARTQIISVQVGLTKNGELKVIGILDDDSNI